MQYDLTSDQPWPPILVRTTIEAANGREFTFTWHPKRHEIRITVDHQLVLTIVDVTSEDDFETEVNSYMSSWNMANPA